MDFNKFLRNNGYLRIHKQLSLEDMKSLAEFLQSNREIKKLTLVGSMIENFNIPEGGAKVLANTSLTCLHFIRMEISDKDAEALANGNLTDLTSLGLFDSTISDKGIKALANGNLTGLTSLRLVGSSINNESIEALANNNFKSLTSLFIEGGNVGDKGAKALTNGNLTNLTSLHFNFCKISDKGAEFFSDALKKGNLINLTSLSLAFNKIGDRGAEALSEALKEDTLKNLTLLDLTGNRIDNKGAKALKRAKKNLNIDGLRDYAKALLGRTNSISEPEISSSNSIAQLPLKRSKSDTEANNDKSLTPFIVKCSRKFLAVVRKGTKKKSSLESEASTISSSSSTMESSPKDLKVVHKLVIMKQSNNGLKSISNKNQMIKLPLISSKSQVLKLLVVNQIQTVN